MLAGLRKLFGLETRSLANPSDELLAWLGSQPTAAGVSVTAQSAMRSPATCAAIRVISETVGQLPIHLYRRNADGGRERDTTHPAAALLSGDANPWCHGTQLRTTVQTDALLHATGFAQVVRAGGKPRELHRLDPAAVSTTWDDATGEPSYRVRLAKGGERVLAYSDVIAIPTPGSAPGRPMCLIDLAREAISLDLVMAEYQARLFSNGARPSGLLSTDKNLSDVAATRVLKGWAAAYGGATNSGKTALLESGIKFSPLSFSSIDSQALEMRRLVIEEIARIFKVPLTLIGSLDRATWRNVEELMRQFVQTCLLPWLEVWQAALSRALLTPEERQTYFIEVVLDDLLRGDTASRYVALRNAVGGAWLVPNEARQLDNRPPIDGGDELIRQAGQGVATDQPTESAPADASLKAAA